MGERQLAKLFPDFPPSSLIDQLMQYQKHHSNSLRLAHVFSTVPSPPTSTQNTRQPQHDPKTHHATPTTSLALALAPFFGHIHVSHPSAGVLAAARQTLSAHHTRHWHQARFTFGRAGCGDADDTVAAGSVDFCIVLVTDRDDCVQGCAAQWMRAARDMLTPNGVLAVVRVNTLWDVAYEELDRGVGSAGTRAILSLRDLLYQEFGLADGLCESGLDWLDYDPAEYYEIVAKRISIHTAPVGKNELLHDDEMKMKRQERFYDFSKKNGDRQADGWDVEVPLTWFQEYTDLLCYVNPERAAEAEESIVDVLEDIKEFYRRGRGDADKFKIRLGCSVVLLTRNIKSES